MSEVIVLTVCLSALIGVALGLLGGGGSILTVPLLAYVARVDPRHAIAMSLLVVGATSVIAVVNHARAGRVSWRVALPFGVTAMAGAYGGGLVAQFVPDKVLMVAFAVIMLVAGVAMLQRRDPANDHGSASPLAVVRIGLLGVAVGVISGLVGAGGGFLLVPALALLAGLPMPIAVGTSLVVISMQSFAGLAGHLSSVQIDWRLATFVTLSAAIGALIGGRLVALVDPATLRRAFGWFVLLMASVIVAREVDPAIGATAGAVILLAAGMSWACTRYAHCPLRRVLHLLGPDTASA